VGTGFMNVFKNKAELRTMGGKELFKLALDQKMSKCLIGETICCLFLKYKESHFCISEIFGHGCEITKTEQSETELDHQKGEDSLLPFGQEMDIGPVSSAKKAPEFKVYRRDRLSRSAIFLGKIVERRKKERGDNLKALLNKAIIDFSNCVEDPSTIFLMS
jgi:hypothetical protein